MTFKEAYTSLLKLYKNLMFPPPSYVQGGQINRTGWTMSQIDEMDVHFFNDLFGEEAESQQEKEVYLSAVW
ncbi:hypothetical protein BN988_01596 [Oceanobacillus picturae]|uniref:Uncharacterized protein n=1 Tax=Oceanobacillus picturae TaxID=171693 RepID=W9AKC2_9BACI|nr:hypothetical protein BN988_01596 [Oceanobacillus picturae]